MLICILLFYFDTGFSLSFYILFEEKFPTFVKSREGMSQLGVGRGGPPTGSRRRLKYDRRHMAKAQKLTSLKRT